MQTFSLASVHLGWSPRDFWTATPPEFWAAVQAWQQKTEVTTR